MCGFVGFANSNIRSTEHTTTIIHDMMNTILHRGPDKGGVYTDDHVTLGFRRLMVIDLTEEASQPMYNEDRSCYLLFNGEVFNYQELREELIAKGHQFISHADSEVVLHGYEEYGAALLPRLRGMFAFIIWDTRKEALFFARDMFGIKPLYYTQNTSDNSLLFGSEIKSFLKYPSFQKQLNNDALKPYLTFQYSVLDETFFKGVYKLKPGHYMLYRQGHLEMKRYTSIEFEEKENSLAHYIDKIKATLRESVRYHTISDVEVGAFLSGGVDSSYITALSKPKHTFTVGFQDYDGIFNETDLAKDLSDILHIKNHKKLITADDCFDILPTIQYHMDEPHSNLSSLPLYFLSELASKHVTVVLSGEGADELFGGYIWYQKSPSQVKYEKVPYFIRRSASLVSNLLPKSKLTNFIKNCGLRVEERFIGQAKVFSEQDAMKVLREAFTHGPSAQSITNPYYEQVPGKDDVTKMQYLDLHLWLPGDILLKADKMSMAHSLELRVPFLDKEVLAMAAEIPTRFRVNSQDTKYALRAASKEVLPEAWANREKVGFPVPIRHWLREEKYYKLVRDMFLSDTAKLFFNIDKLIDYLDAHYMEKANYARYIWTVYVYLVWYKRFFEE